MTNAQWIWINNDNNADEYAVFFESINYNGGGATLEISVGGDYAVYINDVLAEFGQYPDYRDYKIYDKIDISSYLKKGENQIKIIGWYIGKSFSTGIDAGAGIVYEIYNDDGVMCCSTAGKTKCALCDDYISYQEKIITVQLGFGYSYDTRAKNQITNTTLAVKSNSFDDDLSVLVQRPIKMLDTLPTSIAKCIDEKKRLYDLGQESSGVLHIRFKASSGEKVLITYGEHIVDGGVRRLIGSRDFSFTLIANGEMTEFIGPFRRIGGRYLEVVCDSAVDVEFIGIKERNYPVTKVPFDAGNELRQKIYDTAVKTLHLCMHEHYEDTPWREQSMYIMDSRNQMLSGYYAFGEYEFAKAAIKLILQGQKENGLYELCFPASVVITIPSFSLVLPTIIKEYTIHSKDKSLLVPAFSALEKMMKYFIIDENGLIKTLKKDGIWNFYEWAGSLDGSFFNEDDAVRVDDRYDVLINSFYSIACSDMAYIASELRAVEKTKYYLDIKSNLNKAIHDNFYVEKTKLFKNYLGVEEYSQLANSLCILAGACSEKEQNIIADKLAYGYDNWIENTLSMNMFRFDALLLTNKDKYSDVILAEIDKTYAYMLDCGATSFWETIKGDADFGNAGSLCHGWSATPAYYYHKLIK